jgi:hypothetical protein
MRAGVYPIEKGGTIAKTTTRFTHRFPDTLSHIHPLRRGEFSK